MEIFVQKIHSYYDENFDLQLEELQVYLKEKQVTTIQELTTITAAKQEFMNLEIRKEELQKDYDEAVNTLRQVESQLHVLEGRIQAAVEQAKSCSQRN